MLVAPVVSLAAAFAAGAWLSFVLVPPLPIAALVTLALAGVALAAGPWRGLTLAAGLAGVLVAQLHEVGHVDCRSTWRSGNRAAIVRVHDAPGARGLTTASVLHDGSGCEGPVRIRVETKVQAGETVVAVGVVVGSTFRVDHLRRLARPRPPRFRIRSAVQRRIASLYGDRAPLVEAMVLGRRDDVDPVLRQQFVAAGIAHLLAISGLHVGILAAWVALACGRLTRQPRAWAFGAVVAWGYVALLGFPASATRAAVFISVTALSQLRQRNPGIVPVIGVAVIGLLVVDPRACTAVGAWLSVAAVLGTTAGGRILSAVTPLGGVGVGGGRGGGRPRWMDLARLAASSAGATVMTAPITAFAFGQVAPVGILTNLVAVPLAGVAVPGLFLSLLGGKTLAGGAGLALAGIEWVGRLAAGLPGGHLEGAPGLGFGAVWAALSAVAIGVGWRYPTLGVATRRMVTVGAIGAWISVAGSVRPPGPRQLTITVLDVGQGDAILVRTPRGAAILVDGGPRSGGFDAGERVVVPALERLGVEALDAVIVSHPDADHLGGVPAVLERFPVRYLIEPGQPVGSALYQETHHVVEESGIRWVAGRAGDTLRVDSLTLAFLHPTAEWMARRVVPNENSLVVKASYGGFDALLTGDAGFPAESVLTETLGPVEVLKVGHHGSAGSTGVVLLDVAAPLVAVISVGRRNRYGHPAPAVLDRLREHAIEVFRTDQGGTVTIQTDGRYFAVRQGSPSILEQVLCRVLTSSRSRGSSSSGNACSPRRQVTLPTSSTTSPSPAR